MTELHTTPISVEGFKRFGILLTLASCLVSASAASAKTPEKTVEELIDALVTLNAKAGQPQVVEALHARLDLKSLAERSLGSTWKDLSEPQRRTFDGLLRELLKEVAYPNAAKAFDPKFERSVENRGERRGRQWVSVELNHPDQGLIELDFFLVKSKADWKIFDVHLDGVSLALNIQTQMQDVIKKESYEALLKRIRERIEKKA